MSKLGIPYENGGPIALCVNSVLIVAMDRIKPMPEVEEFNTMVGWTYKG
jgi:hypothetical protein